MRPESRTLLLCLVTCAFHVARTYSQSQPHFNELHMLELLTCVARATECARPAPCLPVPSRPVLVFLLSPNLIAPNLIGSY